MKGLDWKAHRCGSVGALVCCMMLGAWIRDCSSQGTRLAANQDQFTRQRVACLTGVSIPKSAKGIHVHEQTLMVRWVYVRFDVAESDIASFLGSSPRLPRAADLCADKQMLEELAAVGKTIPWWRPQSHEGQVLARKTGVVGRGSPRLEWTVTVCTVPISPNAQRIYFVCTEEPI